MIAQNADISRSLIQPAGVAKRTTGFMLNETGGVQIRLRLCGVWYLTNDAERRYFFIAVQMFNALAQGLGGYLCLR